MYINRAKALLLVGTISAGYACSDDDGADTPGVAGSAGANTGGTSTAGSAGRGGSGGANQGGTNAGTSSGGTNQGGTAGSSSAGSSGQVTVDAGDPDAGDAGNTDAGNTDGLDAGDGGTLTCDDTIGPVVDCSSLDELDCGDAGAEFLSAECEMLEFNFKPVPGNAARNCMNELAPADLCVEGNRNSCMAEALGASCPDPEADDDCEAIVLVCEEQLPSFSACSSVLSGMTESGRTQMVDCMTLDTCDLNACISGLVFAG